MKNLFDDIQKIKKLIEKKGGAVLLLDFDGVLSAIAPTPDEAFISDENTALLKECAKRFPVAIITGRELSDIKKKMNIKGLSYIASHGLEWEEDEKYQLSPDFLMEMLDLNEQAQDVSEQAGVDRLTETIDNFKKEIYVPVEKIITHYQDGITTEKELLQVKEYYYRKKYLDRILAGLR